MKRAGTAAYGTVRTVVWEDAGGNPASCPVIICGSAALGAAYRPRRFGADQQV